MGEGLFFKINLWSFFLQTAKAILGNAWRIVTTYSIPIYLLLLLIAVSAFNFWKSKDKLQLAAMLVCVCLMGTLIAFYSVSPFYFVKQTAMLLPLLLVAVMGGSSQPVKWSIFLLLLFFWVPVNKMRTEIIKGHREAYAHLQNNQPLKQSFQQLRQVVKQNKDLVVLWCYNEFDYGNCAQSLLPYSSLSGNPILYTSNIIFDHTIAPQEKFKLHHKLKVDYILSRHPLDYLADKLVLKTDYYSFYQLD